jgi:hypothetical protein
MMKFRIINWAAQIEAWQDFTQLNPEQHPNTASLSEAFSNLSKTFAKQEVSLTWDNMLGRIIQSILKDQLRESVDQKVDLFMEAHTSQIPTAQDVIRFVNAACCGTTIQSEKSLRREIVNHTTNNVSCATGAVDAAFKSNTDLGRVVKNLEN